VEIRKTVVCYDPDRAKICTFHVERQNPAIRTQIRRVARLTNAFSKKWEDLWAAYCLWFTFYNLCRIHQVLSVTPAMEAGLRITFGNWRNCWWWRRASMARYTYTCHSRATPCGAP
jgi:hypothetical protein